jgi:hypothetical protein
LKILKNYTQYPFGKVRNNEAFGAIKIRANLRIKAAKNDYLLTPIAIQIQRLDYSDMSSLYDAKNNRIRYGGYEKIANSFLR